MNDENYVPYPAAVKFWQEKQLWFSNTYLHRTASLVEFAAWLGIPEGTLSILARGVREPSDKNLHILFKKLGPELFEVYNSPMLIDNDPVNRLFADLMTHHDITEEDKKEIVAAINQWKKKFPRLPLFQKD